MKNLKYVKLFESFVNEELSPELELSAETERRSRLSGDDLLKRIKAGQMGSLLRVNSPKVKELYKKLDDHLKSTNSLCQLKPYFSTNSLTPAMSVGSALHGDKSVLVTFTVDSGFRFTPEVPCFMYVLPNKVKFDGELNSAKTKTRLEEELLKDRLATRLIEQLTKAIQQDELPSM